VVTVVIAAYEGMIVGEQDRREKAVYLVQTVEAEFAVCVARTHRLPTIEVAGARKILDQLPPYGPRQSFTEGK